MEMGNKEFITNFIFRVIITIGVVGGVRHILDAIDRYYFQLEAMSERTYFVSQFLDCIGPIIIVLTLYFVGNWALRLFKYRKPISEVTK
jgi:hypothetical protein